MNRKEYMQELYQRLKPLPLTLEDVNDAMRFYEEYFDEAGPERELDVITELGSPAYVAAQVALKLTGSIVPKSTVKPSIKKNVNVVYLIIIGIFAAPIALPLAFAAVVVMVSLLFAAFCVVASFGFSGIVCMITGAGVAMYSVTLLLSDGFATTIYIMGSGLFTFGVGGLLAILGWWLCGLLIKGSKMIGMYLFNKYKKDEVNYYGK